MADKTIGTEDSEQRQGNSVEGGQASQSGPQEGGDRKAAENKLDPSAPGETGTTPGSNGKPI